MPDIAAILIFIRPTPHGNTAGNAGSRIVLVAAHDFQNTVGIVGHGVEADELMCHRDGKQVFGNVLPVVQRLIVGISPMEVEILVKYPLRAGIGKINCLIRLHGDENLHQGK